jgi:hypothetical protein
MLPSLATDVAGNPPLDGNDALFRASGDASVLLVIAVPRLVDLEVLELEEESAT